VKYAQSLIDDFYGIEKNPFIAVSVDMLDTGIDVPEIVNLVFFKVVKSKAKFWQMIGRGTRTCKDLFSPGQDKEYFCIFDFCENFEFFNQNPEGYTPGKQESLSQKIFKKRLQLIQQLTSPEQKELRSSILDIMHKDIMSLNPDSCLVRPHGKYLDVYKQRDKWDNLSDLDISDLSEHLSHLPSQKEEDEFAKRFDSYILSLQLSLTKKSPAGKGMRKGIVELAEKLEQKSNIPAIGEHIDFIHENQSDSFWENISLTSLELVRGVLRGLIKFLDFSGGKEIVITDFKDTIGEVREEKGLYTVSDFKDYRKKVEKYIREHENHLTIYKLKYNKPLTGGDIQELEKMLFNGSDLERERILRLLRHRQASRIFHTEHCGS
jgi:type I restriction enzyme R subunit